MTSPRGVGALLLVYAMAVAGAMDPIATVSQGSLRGRCVERNNLTVYSFEGIPYARPPLGERRFKEPEAAEPWRGEYNATATGANCVQWASATGQVIGDENCLFINVFTSSSPEKWESTKQPVIVWFHYGSFLWGSGNMDTLRPDTFLKEGFVFVSLNYRLDALGFLNTEDSAAPGNAGLKDMVLALRWVKENIAAFGGDSEQVSIMGLSAGGAAVNYLTISPLASGLFKRAVALSGSALNPWAFMEKPRNAALSLRSKLPCEADVDLKTCLQSVNAQDLLSNWKNAGDANKVELHYWKNGFVPSVEASGSSPSPFLSERPEVLTNQTSAMPVPIMTGFVDNEGMLLLERSGLNSNDSSRWALLSEHILEVIQTDLPEGLNTIENARRVRDFYLADRKVEDAPTDLETLEKFLRMCSDEFFMEGVIRTAVGANHRGAPMYLYEFTYDSPAVAIMKNTKYNMPHVHGVAHGDDAVFLFDTNLTLSEDDKTVQDKYVSFVSNFLKTGNPTPEGSSQPSWPLYMPDKESYAEIGKEVHYKEHVLAEHVNFWRQLQSS